MAPLASAGRGGSTETDAHTRRELTEAIGTISGLRRWYIANASISALFLAFVLIACWMTGSPGTIGVVTLVLMGSQLLLILVGIRQVHRRPLFWSILMAVLWTLALTGQLRSLSSLTGHTRLDVLSLMTLLLAAAAAVISWFYVPGASRARELLRRFPELATTHPDSDRLTPDVRRLLERARVDGRRAWKASLFLVVGSAIVTVVLGGAAWWFSRPVALEPYGERFRSAWNSNRFDDITVLARDSWRGECAAFLQHQVRKRHWEQGLPQVDLGKAFPQQNRVDFAYGQGDLQTFWTLEAGVWRLVAISLPK